MDRGGSDIDGPVGSLCSFALGGWKEFRSHSAVLRASAGNLGGADRLLAADHTRQRAGETILGRTAQYSLDQRSISGAGLVALSDELRSPAALSNGGVRSRRTGRGRGSLLARIVFQHRFALG